MINHDDSPYPFPIPREPWRPDQKPIPSDPYAEDPYFPDPYGRI
jgi:hypothetical protein